MRKMSQLHFIRSSVAVFNLVLSSLCFAQNDTTVEGFVRDSSAKPIRGAILSLVPAEATADSTIFSAVSHEDGSFLFTDVAAGKYRVCGLVLRGWYINPCIWGYPAPSVDVSAGQRASRVELVLPDGAALNIRLLDDQKVMNHQRGPGSDRFVVVSVVAAGPILIDAERAVEDSIGRTDRIVVPTDREVQLVIHGPGIDVHDERDRKLGPEAQDFRVSVSKGQSEGRMLRFKIKRSVSGIPPVN